MSVNEKDRYIQHLVDRVNETESNNRTLRLVLDDFVKEKEEMKGMLSDLQAEHKRRKEKPEGLEAQCRKQDCKAKSSTEVRSNQSIWR